MPPVAQLRASAVLLLPPATLALLGSALLLQRPSLWYDELFTAHVGGLGVGRLVDAVLSGQGTTAYLQSVPPSYNAPYYVVVQGWLSLTRQDPGELALRSLSLLCAVVGLALLTRAVARLGGRPVAVAAGLLAATNPLLLEYSVEARGYGLAVLATSATALGLARWLDGGRLRLYALGALGAGLAHWFALPVVAALALSGLLLRRRAALPLLGVTALAVLPALALVLLATVQDDGGVTTGWIDDTGGAVPALALQAWTRGSPLLLTATGAAALAGLVLAWRDTAARRTAVVGACWLALPLLLVTLAELVRPVFVPRYLLPALLGLAVLAATGAGRSRWPAVATALLTTVSLVAAAPLLDRGPREDARGAVAALAAQSAPGEPVVAVDRRAALALEHYAPDRLAYTVPPTDPPAGAPVVWLLRQASREGAVRVSDDDALLTADGLHLAQEQVFRGSSSWLVLQRWTR